MKGGNYTYIKDKINTHFTNLIEDEDFATFYFSLQSNDNYSIEKLLELKKKVNSATKKYYFGSQLLSVATFTGAENLIKNTVLRLEKERKILSNAKNELEIFESNLAYLILSGKIISPDELGFSSEYVKELLSRKKIELENSIVEYYYDESTGITFQVNNDEFIALPYTPNVVANTVRKNKAKKLTDKDFILRRF